MSVFVKSSLLFIFFLCLFQASGISSGRLSFHPVESPSYLAVDASLPDQLESNLYSPDTLKLPDALVSPVPSFQFGFVESVACFLFIIFCLYVPLAVKETTLFFTNPYFPTLFSSLILINAP